MDAENLSGENIDVLTFTLGAEEYAINIQQVHEICGYGDYHYGQHACLHKRRNLRGVIVTFVDMRIKFNPGTPTYDASTVLSPSAWAMGPSALSFKPFLTSINWSLTKSSRVDNWAR